MGVKGARAEHSSDHAIAGAVSGFMTRLICQPIDVIKIRFQFYSYNKIIESSRSFATLDHWQNSAHFVAGAIAGSIATVVSFPFDTVRTRLVAQAHHQPVYKGFISIYISILKTESPRGFYRGLSPTLLQIAPHTGLQFVFYSLLTDFYKSFSDGSSTTVPNSMIAGSAAGLFAKTAVYPLDLARKRLQIQGFEHGRIGFGKFFSCRGLMECLSKTAKNEGLRGLFKGLLPSQLKAAATTALHFTFYEQALVLLHRLRV
ncbi:mitochondrial thiamine pyrophosphate carrier-like isoform X2 [Diachasmimorpha longicaudata]|uniref:mitochondrial thiamine pyrophosphate carrier-like isoform X2 n=1 Tax=Diachasmimorpha longicaudata TaxID=58733 RepID=UPI0030B898D7